MPSSAPLIQEKQAFRAPWLWFLMVGLNGCLLWVAFRQLVQGIPVGSTPLPDAAVLVLLLLILALSHLLFVMQLSTELFAESLHVRFFPFVNRTFLLADVRAMYPRECSPLAEFGGWGIRWSWGGMAYNVAGRAGIQLELRSGKRVFVGTQRPEDWAAALALSKFPSSAA